MQFARAIGGVASACLVLLVAACGGGGSDDDAAPSPSPYPENNTVVLSVGSVSNLAGTYILNTPPLNSGWDVSADSRNVEIATVENQNGTFQFTLIFVQNDTRKFILTFDDASDNYFCRSADLSITELQGLMGNPITDVPVCGAGVTIDAINHRLKAAKVTIPSLANPSTAVTISANFAWTI